MSWKFNPTVYSILSISKRLLGVFWNAKMAKTPWVHNMARERGGVTHMSEKTEGGKGTVHPARSSCHRNKGLMEHLQNCRDSLWREHIMDPK